MSEGSPKTKQEARLTILHPKRCGRGANRSVDWRRHGVGGGRRRSLGGGGVAVVSDVVPSRSVTRQRAALLQVLEEASVAEVVDVSTEKHQFGVDVIGHTVVGGHCVAYSGWHNEGGGTVEHAVPTASHQGTKSEEGQKYRSGSPTGNIF